MTTFGKILVVIHLVLSVIFMAFAGAVYTAQTNWMTKAKTAATAQKKVETDYANLQDVADKERTAAKAVKDRLEQQVTTLQGEKSGLEMDNRIIVDDNKKLTTMLDAEKELAKLNSEEANERSKESMLQREKNAQLNQTRDVVIAELKKLEDKVFAMELQKQQFGDKYAQLLRDYATVQRFLASKGLTTDPKQMLATTQPPTDVDGVVLEARKAEKGSSEFVQISIGSDDDLRIGHVLTVYNHDKYLGRIRLIRVTPDEAVGLVIEKAKNTTIQRGDNVTTKL